MTGTRLAMVDQFSIICDSIDAKTRIDEGG
jgi:hypothetical protein